MSIDPSIMFALLATLAVTGLLIPALKVPAHRLKLIDKPCHRKRHFKPTPLTGGLALCCGFMIGLLIIPFDWSSYWTLLTGMGILLLLGVLDDYADISATLRLLVQMAVASIMVFGGGLDVHILGAPFGDQIGPVGLGPFSALFTIVCVVFMINAINMADGLDGLAGGMVLVMLGLLALTGLLDDAPFDLIALCLLLAMATLGFLIHNMRTPFQQRARAFLGDSGSMALGYAVAWLAVSLGTREGGNVDPIVMAWILIVPAMDTLALFFRRIRIGRNPLSPDRTHMHHILLRCGYSVPRVVHTMHLLVLAAGLFGLYGWVSDRPEWQSFALAAAVLLGYMALLGKASKILRWHQKRTTEQTPSDSSHTTNWPVAGKESNG